MVLLVRQCATSEEKVRLLEGALLELQCAERRQALAKQALQDFEAENDGKILSAELAQSLVRERFAGETEFDEARRRHEEGLRQCHELRDAS
jgi:hypothetical protein